MANRAQGLLDDDTTPPVQAPPAAPTLAPTAPAAPSSTNRASGLASEPATAPALPPADTTATGNSFWYDALHQQAADLSRPQTWRDWLTRTYSPSAQDVGNAALDDVSMGTADYAQSKLPGAEDIAKIRARTAASQAALGPMGPVVNALTYVLPGTGEMKAVALPGKFIGKAAQAAAPYVGRYGAGALEGATASGLSSVGHQLGGDIDPYAVAENTALGGVAGVGGQALGDITAPAVRRVADYVTSKSGRTGGDPRWEDLRGRALAGENITPDLAQMQQGVPPGGPADQVLQNVNDAAAASVAPGWMSKGVREASTLGAGGYGLLKSGGWGGLAGMAAADRFNAAFTNPIARFVNTADRNINVNQAFDQAYPAFGRAPVTTNVQPWADALCQLAIGGSR